MTSATRCTLLPLARTGRFALAVTFALLGPVSLWSAAPPAAARARPNVLIVLVDDAGYGDFSCHGHPFLRTPQIDRLHAESVRLTDFHAAPMCSPTRGQLLTGVHGLRTGVTSVTAARTFLRPEFATAPQLFAAAGWRTGIFGKWHLGDSYPHRPMDKGFQTAVWLRGWGFTSAPEFSNTLIAGTVQRGEKAEKFPGYITDFCFDEAMAWMRGRQAKSEPFFCYLPLNAAHAPHTVPEKYLAPFAGKPAPAFFGMMANLDENMGRLDDFLRETGLRENTIVIFMTDNGATAGANVFNAGLRGRKTMYYEGGHRVPCFIRWPAGGLRTAGDVAAVTQVQDVLPTLLEFAGMAKPAGPDIDGLSLAPLLRGKTDTLPDRTIVVQYGPGAGAKDTSGPKKFQSAVLWNQWRLVHGTELYDVNADRGQAHDLAAAHPEIVADLRRRYEVWWSTVAPRLDEFVPVSLGAAAQNPVLLTSSDWQDAYADNSNHVRNAVGGPRGGPWNVHIERAGDYEIALRRWPFDLDAPLDGNITPPGKALPIAAAKLTVAGRQLTTPAAARAREVVFRTSLPVGRTQLQAWFQDADGRDVCGAFFVKVTRRDL
jgi:arylsulfatase